jgi:hypothetical protein
MSRIIQPPGIVRINPRIPQPAFVFCPSAGLMDWTKPSRVGTNASGDSVRPTAKGMAYKVARVNDGGLDFGVQSPLTGDRWTILALANPASNQGISTLFSQRYGSAAPYYQTNFCVNAGTLSSFGDVPGGLQVVIHNNTGFNCRTTSTALVDGAWHTFAATRGYGGVDSNFGMFRDGVALATETGGSTVSGIGGAQKVRIGNLGNYTVNDAYCAQCDIALVVAWDSVLSTTLLRQLTPDQVYDTLFTPSRRVWVQLGPAAGDGAVTGTATITPSPQTLTGTAAVTGGAVTGTATITPSPQTLTGTGAVAVGGTLNATPAAQTVTTAAAVAITGTLNRTPSAQTVTTAGAVAVAGTANITPAAQTVSATGTVVSGIVGTANITPAAQTVTANGAVALGATATITPSAQTVTGTAAVTGGTVTGTANITPAAQTVTASATVSGGAVTGTANIYVSAQTLVASANIIVLGTANITPAAQTLLAYEAGVLPAEVPGSSRTLAAESIRLGSSPVAADPQRLGASTVNKASPRLG